MICKVHGESSVIGTQVVAGYKGEGSIAKGGSSRRCLHPNPGHFRKIIFNNSSDTYESIDYYLSTKKRIRILIDREVFNKLLFSHIKFFVFGTFDLSEVSQKFILKLMFDQKKKKKEIQVQRVNTRSSDKLENDTTTSRKVYQGPAGGEARITPRDWKNRKRNRWTTTTGVPESNDVTVKSSEGLQVQKW
ncbi:hypothetical protein ANTRET_LOCUS4040 [Anthophora retusa]